MPSYRLNHPQWLNRNGAHIESFFLKANDPNAARAVWLKVTCLQKPGTKDCPAEKWLDVWCCVFDKSNQVFEGARQRFDLLSLDFGGGVLQIQNKSTSLHFGKDSGCFKTVVTDKDSRIEVDLTWQADTSNLGEGYTMFPFSWMLQGPFPKQKTVTPIGLCHVNGMIVSSNETYQVTQWVGCQGHNWGLAHTPDYAWMHTVLLDESGIAGTCEAFSGSVQAGSRQLGPFSGLVLRLKHKTYRFDRLIDTWNHTVQIEAGSYSLELRKGRTHLVLSATTELDSVVCLGYEDPDGTMHYCMNSKLANVSIQLTENGECLTFSSHQLGALEWLSGTPKAKVI